MVITDRIDPPAPFRAGAFATPAASATPTTPPTDLRPDALTAPPETPGSRRTVAGYGALALALLACPCHLPLTLGLIGAVAGGTAVAALTSSVAFFAVATLVFLAALASGWWLLQSRHA